MKRVKKKILSMFLSVLMVISVIGVQPINYVEKIKAAVTTETKTFDYMNCTWNCIFNISDGNYTLVYIGLKSASVNTIYVPDKISVYIPVYGITTYTSFPVSKIGVGNYDGIKEIVLPSSIISIEDQAFYNCTKLEKISFIENCNIQNIGTRAFYGCTVLKDISNLLERVQNIKDYAFYNCTSLSNIHIGTEVGDLFIGASAFRDCTSLTEVEILNNKSIYFSEKAFYGCTGIEILTFNDKLDTLTFNGSAFHSCTNITNISLSAHSIYFYGGENFYGCAKLNNITFSGETYFYSYDDFTYTFKTGKNGKVTFGSSVNCFYAYSPLSNGCFSNATNLEIVEFKGSANLNNNFFLGCSVKKILFEDYATLTDHVFVNMDLDEVIFNKSVYFYNNTAVYGFLSTSTIKNLVFNGELVTLGTGFGNFSSVENIAFGKDCIKISGNISDISKVSKIVFWNYNPDITNLTATLEKNNTIVYSYKGTYTENGNVIISNKCSDWASKYDMLHGDIVSSLSVEQNENKYIEGTTINLDNAFSVTANYAVKNEQGDLTKKIVRDDTSKGIDSYIILDSNGNVIKDGKIVLKAGSNEFIFRCSGKEKTYNLIGTAKAVERLEVIVATSSTFIAGQIIDKNQLNVVAIYNNNDRKTLTNEEYSLSKNKLNEDINEITVAYNGNTDITQNINIVAAKNTVATLSAIYTGEDVFIGKEFDLSKVKVSVEYIFDDPDLDKNIKAGYAIKGGIVTKQGENIFELTYGGKVCELKVIGRKVAVTEINVTYNDTMVIYGQELDKKNIVVIAKYNDGSMRTLNQEEYKFKLYNISSTSNIVTITFEGKEGSIIVPGAPKSLIGLEVTYPDGASGIIEGSKIPKEELDIILKYNDGSTEILNDKTELLIDDYEIKAEIENKITVSYKGVKGMFIIRGLENILISINATYTGKGVVVGNKVPLSDIKVIGTYINGNERQLINNYILQDEVIYKVGKNEIVVHYGTLSTIVKVVGLAKSQTEPTTTSKPSSATAASISVSSSIKNITLNNSTKETYKILTNKTITFTLTTKNIKKIAYQLVTKGSKLNEKAWKGVTKNKICISKTTKPSVLYIRYMDVNGNIKIVKTKGFLIDKKFATITGVKNKKTYRKAVTIKFKDTNGIKSAKLNKKNIKSGTKVKKHGKYTLIVIDKAGNKRTLTFIIKSKKG